MTHEKEIIRERVKEAWDSLCLYEEIFGVGSESATIQRYKWRALDELYTDLYDEDY